MWNLRNKADEHMGRGIKGDGNKPQETLNREQTEVWWREVGGGWTQWVMGSKWGICYEEHWVLYAPDESLNSSPETNNTLYVN